jgi:hypothetical protein
MRFALLPATGREKDVLRQRPGRAAIGASLERLTTQHSLDPGPAVSVSVRPIADNHLTSSCFARWLPLLSRKDPPCEAHDPEAVPRRSLGAGPGGAVVGLWVLTPGPPSGVKDESGARYDRATGPHEYGANYGRSIDRGGTHDNARLQFQSG